MLGSTAMELILIRHAEAQSRISEDGTPADPSLTQVGQEQARAVARWLAREPIESIISSPSRRARETAHPLGERLGLEVEIDARLSEIDPAANAYRSIEAERARDRAAYRERIAAYQTDERLADLSARVERSLGEWAARSPGKRLAAFTHGGVINVWTRCVLGLEPGMLFEAQNGSIQRYLVSREGRRGLKSLNETAHLG